MPAPSLPILTTYATAHGYSLEMVAYNLPLVDANHQTDPNRRFHAYEPVSDAIYVVAANGTVSGLPRDTRIYVFPRSTNFDASGVSYTDNVVYHGQSIISIDLIGAYNGEMLALVSRVLAGTTYIAVVNPDGSLGAIRGTIPYPYHGFSPSGAGGVGTLLDANGTVYLTDKVGGTGIWKIPRNGTGSVLAAFGSSLPPQFYSLSLNDDQTELLASQNNYSLSAAGPLYRINATSGAIPGTVAGATGNYGCYLGGIREGFLYVHAGTGGDTSGLAEFDRTAGALNILTSGMLLCLPSPFTPHNILWGTSSGTQRYLFALGTPESNSGGDDGGAHECYTRRPVCVGTEYGRRDTAVSAYHRRDNCCCYESVAPTPS